MRAINPADLQPHEFYRFMIGTVGPRPIAFASTVDATGHVNLSPFSFFTIAGYNPPTLLFIPTINRHGRKKHTLLNLEEVGEVVINVVNYAMVEQMSLTSAEFDQGINEFEKAGFTAVPSSRVRPPRVAESPASFECIVRQIIPTATKSGTVGVPTEAPRVEAPRVEAPRVEAPRVEAPGVEAPRVEAPRVEAPRVEAPGVEAPGVEAPGAGHLVICELVMAHFHESIFDAAGAVDPHRLDLIGRMGGDWYCRAQGDALFEVARPTVGIGIDQMPVAIRSSAILSGNELGKLGSAPALPTADEVAAFRASGVLNELFNEARNGCQYLPDLLHVRAKQLLADHKVHEAWLTLLQAH